MVDRMQEVDLGDLEKQVADIEGLLAKLGGGGGPGPKSDDADASGSGRKNIKTPRVKMHKAKKKPPVKDDSEDEEDDGDDEDMEKSLGDASVEELERVLKAKKKPPADDSEDGDGSDGEDDWSAESDKKKGMKKGVDYLMVDNKVIRKKDVGDAAFTILKAQSDKVEKVERDIAKERDLRETAEFAKRADDLYKHVPGTLEDRTNILKAIDKMPDTLKKAFETVLTAHEKLAKGLFEMKGVKGGADESMEKSAKDFDTKVNEIRKRDNCSRTDALQKARTEFPEEFKAYQSQN